MKVVYIGAMNSIGKPINGFTKAMGHYFGDYTEVNDLRTVISCDLLFIQTQDTGLDVTQLERLKNSGAFIINWTGDARDNVPKYCFEYAPYVDVTAFSNYKDVATMLSFGFNSQFLQIGFDPEIYYPSNGTKDIDIVFMGNNYGHFPLSALRYNMVRELKSAYGNRFKAFGIGMPDGSYMGNQQGEADIYRRAKIGINLSHYDYRGYTSDRLFRMMGSGVAILSYDSNANNYKGLPGQSDLIQDFPFLLKWGDITELKAEIERILTHSLLLQHNTDKMFKLSYNYTFTKMAIDIKKLCRED